MQFLLLHSQSVFLLMCLAILFHAAGFVSLKSFTAHSHLLRRSVNIPVAGGVSSAAVVACPFHSGSLPRGGGPPGRLWARGGERGLALQGDLAGVAYQQAVPPKYTPQQGFTPRWQHRTSSPMFLQILLQRLQPRS